MRMDLFNCLSFSYNSSNSRYINLPAQDSFYPEWSPRLYLGSVGIEYHFRRDKASDLVLVGCFNLNRLRRLLMGGCSERLYCFRWPS